MPFFKPISKFCHTHCAWLKTTGETILYSIQNVFVELYVCLLKRKIIWIGFLEWGIFPSLVVPSFDKNISILPTNFSALNFGLEFVAKRSLSLFSILIKAASLKSKGHKGRSVIGWSDFFPTKCRQNVCSIKKIT